MLNSNKILNYLYAPSSVLSMSVLRISFGLFVMWQANKKGVVIFTGTGLDGFDFKYPFFSWVHGSPELAGPLTIAWFISGFLVSTGLLFRISGPFCFIITLYSYLIAAERYLNHEYMELIFLFLLSLSPAHYRLSIDSYIWKFPKVAPTFFLFALKIQTEIILIYAGLVKINYDWLHLQPLSNWLAAKSDLVFFGNVWLNSWGVAVGAYGIILLHILGAPLMFWKKTRLPVFIVYSGFHIINSQIFPIDIFPWMTIACSTLFFSADWPAQILDKIRQWTSGATAVQNGNLNTADNLKKFDSNALNNSLIAVLTIWIVSQALLPIRSVLYTGDVDWTGEGHRFSWRMMLEQRNCPVLSFVIIDKKVGKVIFSDIKTLLNDRKKLNYVCKQPDHIVQVAHALKDIYIKEGQLSGEAAVHLYSMRSLNYRKPTLYVDPMRDLSNESILSWGYTWLNREATLEALPGPGQSEIDNFVKPSPSQVALAMGVDIDRDYNCGYGPTPRNSGGTDIVCNAKK